MVTPTREISEVGVGTTVTVLLPRSLCAAVVKSLAASQAPVIRADGSRCGRLLLVEDDREVAELTREMLSAIGFAVIHASSPDAALGALANGRPIDFVLSDIMMPGEVNGVDLAREIKLRHPNVRIVPTTAYPEAAAHLDGQFGLVLKPYTLESLAEAMGVAVACNTPNEGGQSNAASRHS